MFGPRYKVLVVAALGLLVCAGIVMTGPEPLVASTPQGKPQVTLQKLQREVVPTVLTAMGTLTPRQTLSLTSQIAGEVVWVSEQLVPGGRVGQGDVLFQIDDREYTIALKNAQAQYAQAKAAVELEQGRSEIARLEWGAWQAEQDGNENANPLAMREPQRAEAEAQVLASQASLDRATLNLERTEVSAPWPAAVVRANTVVGKIATNGFPAATLLPIDFGILELEIPLSYARLIELGVQKISLRPTNEPHHAPVSGVIEGLVSSLTSETRLATLRVRVDEPLNYAGWAFGMHLEASLVLDEPREIAYVPADLIVSGNLVWIYRDGKAQRHQVLPVTMREGSVSVEDNFQPADQLIVERPIGLFDGSAVTVTDT